MDKNYENELHQSRELLLGNNFFSTGILTVPANKKIMEGTILQTASGKFTVSTAAAGEVGLCVAVDNVVNASDTAIDVAVRVCIAGPVNSELLLLGSAKATAAQADLLRTYSIVPVKVNQCGSVDNY